MKKIVEMKERISASPMNKAGNCIQLSCQRWLGRQQRRLWYVKSSAERAGREEPGYVNGYFG